jgi:hypothetical protein
MQLDLAITDPNPADTHSITWLQPDGVSGVLSADEQHLTLDPASLGVGAHVVEVIVVDSGTPPLSTTLAFSLALVESLPGLDANSDANGNGVSDAEEGYTDTDDNGIPDYREVTHPQNVLPHHVSNQNRFLLEAEPGTQLTLGSTGLLDGAFGARLGADGLTQMGAAADSMQNVGGLFDFVIHNLDEAGQTVRLVIPQLMPIPLQAVYRKYDAAAGEWFTFVENALNQLASAPGAEGMCPPPGSEAFRPGLNAGDWCVQLTVEDGGPNDADNTVNRSIADPGGVGQPETNAAPQAEAADQPAQPVSGSGAIGPWSLLGVMLALLLRLALERRQRVRKQHRRP